MRVKSPLDRAKEALADEERRLSLAVAEVDAAVAKRPGLVASLEQVQAALAALDPKPVAPRRLKAKPAAAVDRKAAIVEAMARGVAKAHRDLKPGNVTLAKTLAVSDEMFAKVWNEAGRRSEVVAKLGIEPKAASDRAGRMRKQGFKLKKHPGWRIPGVSPAKKPKPAADAEERPAVAPVELPEPTPLVKLDIRPRPSEFRLFARASAAGEVVKKPKVHHVPIEVSGGQVYGHWRVVIETAGERGQRKVLVRSTCEAKTERRVSVGKLVGLKLPAHCKACKPRAKWTPQSRTAAHAASLAKRQARAASGGDSMPETYRCVVQEQGHPCGNLIFARQRRAHLQDVHALDGTDTEVVEGFSGPVDTKANEKEATAEATSRAAPA